jgi:hypothetical protein
MYSFLRFLKINFQNRNEYHSAFLIVKKYFEEIFRQFSKN